MNKGFTLLELVVTMFIIAILSAVLFLGTSKSEAKLALNRAAMQLAQDLREVQEMAMAAKDFDCSATMGASAVTNNYGIHFSYFDRDAYYIYADCDKDHEMLLLWSDPDIIIKKVDLQKGVRIDRFFDQGLDLSCRGFLLLCIDVVFEPPDPATFFTGDLSSEYSSGCETVITLEHEDGGQKKVKINTVGKIEI